MTTTTVQARVWVGCLGCYNAGGLVGAWVDALEAESLEPHEQAAVSMPAVCGDVKAEERWVFDHEGFGGFLEGECSPAEAVRVAETGPWEPVEDLTRDVYTETP